MTTLPSSESYVDRAARLALTLGRTRASLVDAEAEVERLREKLAAHELANGGCVPAPAYTELGEAYARVRALFAGGPDTPCRTVWRDGVEYVEVPMADLRAAFAEDLSALSSTETPEPTPPGVWGHPAVLGSVEAGGDFPCCAPAEVTP